MSKFKNFFNKEFIYDNDSFLPINDEINKLLPVNHPVNFYLTWTKNNERYLISKYYDFKDSKTLFKYNEKTKKYEVFPNLERLWIEFQDSDEIYTDGEFFLYITKDIYTYTGWIYSIYGDEVYDAKLEMQWQWEIQYIIEKDTIEKVVNTANKYYFYSNELNVAWWWKLDRYEQWENSIDDNND